MSPYPSPACDVWLGSHIDCLVGVEDGRVLHFEGSGIESATHLPQLALTTGDYFPPVVAGGSVDLTMASPHCADLDEDGDVDCRLWENVHGVRMVAPLTHTRTY